MEKVRSDITSPADTGYIFKTNKHKKLFVKNKQLLFQLKHLEHYFNVIRFLNSISSILPKYGEATVFSQHHFIALN